MDEPLRFSAHRHTILHRGPHGARYDGESPVKQRHAQDVMARPMRALYFALRHREPAVESGEAETLSMLSGMYSAGLAPNSLGYVTTFR
ncbi:MAG: hypothetical protein CV088_09620 [Nitrospira sp. LK70]|nr:hypothetical protein [Nitrospira sp. LK70]